MNEDITFLVSVSYSVGPWASYLTFRALVASAVKLD